MAAKSASFRFLRSGDRVVQGALKLILEPIFEADFQPGSFGYRPKRTAHEAVDRVAQAIVRHKTRVIDFDLRSYFDNVRHDRLLAKVAKRVNDNDVMHLLKIMLKANGRYGVPQGGVVSHCSVISTSMRWTICSSGRRRQHATTSTPRSSTRVLLMTW